MNILRACKTWVHILLFFVILLTSNVAAAYQNGVEISAMLADSSEITEGFSFSFKLMAILLAYTWLTDPL